MYDKFRRYYDAWHIYVRSGFGDSPSKRAAKTVLDRLGPFVQKHNTEYSEWKVRSGR